MRRKHETKTFEEDLKRICEEKTGKQMDKC